jgi:hypothetical protein
MRRLDQVKLWLPTGEVVTLTVRVDRPGVPRGGPERRRAEEIAAFLWMAAQDEEAPAPARE